MKNQPLVSVIIPCFNSVRYLAQTIDSVLDQTYRNLEIILVDDASSDGTVALINEYMKKDKRMQLVQRRERGGRPAITKNTALEHVSGEFVCFLDHDDYYHPHKIESLLQLLLDHPQCVAAFHNIDLVDSDGEFISSYLDTFTQEAAEYLDGISAAVYLCSRKFYVFQSIHYAALHTISVMIALERFGREHLHFDTRYQVCDDTDLWIRLGMAGEMVYLDRALASYRQHASNITCNKIKLQQDAILLLENNFPRVMAAMNASEQQSLKARISNYYDDLGWMYRCQYVPIKSIYAYFKAWQWSGSSRHLIHAAKAVFPAKAAS